ncbi:MAG: TIGR03936 family radical SAM-associated protein [Treponema sp.]|nr:TIGR03936 family radical SAM-associated protein [Treponema sp.]
MRFIDPAQDLGGLLLEVEKPARYAGGEFGRLAKKDAVLHTLIAFPDLYEIGMSNQALRIIYNRLNEIADISCDRAFAPAPDFEELLRSRDLPLYGLDTGISLDNLDLLMFTLGYELGINGVLTMLDVAGIPIHRTRRNEKDPIVIAGGPAVCNPFPYSQFVDAFWIGEAEAGFFELAAELLELKKRGEGRAALLEKIASHPNVWVKGKPKTLRAIVPELTTAGKNVFPVPSMKTVQHHGVVEIMRGCPNGCRFCHAGFWYRPMRQKRHRDILTEAADLVNLGGWREISLSSLSSGDYNGIENLVENLNHCFADRHISFQLPSLKISGFSLSLLEQISQTRKSGLTFAVETPLDAWQMSINKEASIDSVTAIIIEAKKRGWRSVKFYFMIGLPVPAPATESEETAIVDFITDAGRRTNMHFNINVGIFVPKPHTPYQWAKQLDSRTAAAKLDFIKTRLKTRGHKVSVSDPLVSLIEGILSRGDERIGLLAEEAWTRGSRLDSWSEYIKKDIWREIIENNQDLVDEIIHGRESRETLPWQEINSGVSHAYLKKELEKSESSIFTRKCEEGCKEKCGICNKNLGVITNKTTAVNYLFNRVNGTTGHKSDPYIYRILFSFSKQGSAVCIGHLSLVEIFSMAFNRAGIPVQYTQGFNPLAKIEIAAPLTTGVSADSEFAAVDFMHTFNCTDFVQKLNCNLPDGIIIKRAEIFYIGSGVKKHSLSSLLWGFAYAGANNIEYVRFREEKEFRLKTLDDGLMEKRKASFFSLRRLEVLAKNNNAGENCNEEPEWASYFDVYRSLYPPGI